MTSDEASASAGSALAANTPSSNVGPSLNSSLPSLEDADSFAEKVDEVSRLVDGLAKGTLTPDYVDAKMQRQAQQIQATKVQDKGSRQWPWYMQARERFQYA